MSKLTKTKVDQFRCGPDDRQAFLWDGELRGFGVRCQPSGLKTFIVRGRVKGTGAERFVKIGAYGVFTVDTARSEAIKILHGLATGVDPRAERAKQAALTVTLRQAAVAYCEKKRTRHGPLRESTTRDILRHVDKNLTDWADKPLAGITREKCIERHDKLAQRSKSQAAQAFVNLQAICNWAREQYATDDDFPLLPVNPVSRMFKVRRKHTDTPRSRRVPLGKIGEVWAMLKERRVKEPVAVERMAATLVSFLLLTGARLGEASRLTWDNIDLEQNWIRFPSQQVKNHRELRLPITKTMRELLESIPKTKDNPHVFASRGRKRPYVTDPRGTMDAVSQIAELHLSPHDLGRTAEDIATICRVDADVRRKLLNHAPVDIHQLHYGSGLSLMVSAVERMHAWIESEAAIAEAKHSDACALTDVTLEN